MSVLRDVFSVTAILGGRGIKLESIGGIENTLVLDRIKTDKAYDYIKVNGTKALATASDLFDTELVGCKPETIQKKLADTFEWFISKLLVREFYFHSAQFGVRLKNRSVPTHEDKELGDLDVIGISRNLEPINIECKTGSSKNLKKKMFYNQVKRSQSIQSPYSIIITEERIEFEKLSRLLNGQNAPRGIKEQGSRKLDVYCITSLNELNSNVEVFFWGTLFVVNMNTKRGDFVLIEQLSAVFQIVGAITSGTFWQLVSSQGLWVGDHLHQAGFKIETFE